MDGCAVAHSASHWLLTAGVGGGGLGTVPGYAVWDL